MRVEELLLQAGKVQGGEEAKFFSASSVHAQIFPCNVLGS